MNRCLYVMLCIGLFFVLPQKAAAQLSADFSSNIVSGCAPILVQFTDQSAGNPTSWQWDLGNGTLSNLQNPSTTYLSAGTYAVTLTVTNASGSDTKTVTNYIQVVGSPSVNFTVNDSVSCPPETVLFTDLSTAGTPGTATYFWDFGDGFTSALNNPSHTYTATGNYSVTLSVTNSAGCSKLLTKTNYIQMVSAPIANFTAFNNNSCTLPLAVNFTNSSGGAFSYQWDFGDGSTSTVANPSHTYTSAGSFPVTLIATNASGCSDTMVQPASVNIGSLTASFTKTASSVCTNNPVSFTNTSSPGSGNSTWYFGDGTSFSGANAVHAYSGPGTYTVKLVVNYNNCSDSASQTITVNQGPAPNFTAGNLTGCSVPFTTAFTNTTSGATSYLWLFGDGNTSVSPNPSHTYTAMGNYTVQLVAFGANGCNDTFTRSNYITINPPAVSLSVNPLNSCEPSTVTLTANIPSGITVSSYAWDFGDNTTGTGGPSVTHSYGAGNFPASVTVTTANGCTITTPVQTVNVGTPPVVSFNFGPNPACPNQLVTFNNTSTAPPGTTFSWAFGNGAVSNLPNPTYSYSTPGTYAVTLTATNNGCTVTLTDSIKIKPPHANFQAVYNCTNKLSVQFQNTSTNANSYTWDFGDGTTSTLQNPTHVYTAPGTYAVKLTAVNSASGCNSEKNMNVVLFEVPAVFTANDSVICKGETVTFTSQSTPATRISQYIWDFGNGAGAQTPSASVSHTYNNTGSFTVTLVVKDVRGCFDTLTKANYIQASSPTVNFTGSPLNGCAPLLVNFTDQSVSSGGSIASRIWRFGDGTQNSGNASSVSHTYPAGTYSVQLIVTNTNGCTDSLTKPNYIAATKPTASFSANKTTACPGENILFTNNSTGTSLSYNWSFGDGGTSTSASPSHVYTTTGAYTVRLIVTDGSACKDTVVKTAYINIGGINLSFTASDTFATCPPLTVNFTNTSATASNFNWDFGNGNGSSLTNPTAIYTFPGVYTVKLKGQNGTCFDSVSKTITVLGPTGTFSYTPLTGCAPLTVSFTATNQNTQLLIWDMNNGVTQNTSASTTTYTYTAPGIYVPKLLLSDGAACVVPIQGPDTLEVGKIEADFTFNADSLCGSGTVSFKDTVLFSVSPVASRQWSFGDGVTSAAPNPSHTYNAAGTYTVTLVMSSSLGCTDTVVKTVTILPLPPLNPGSNISVCQGYTTPVQLQATGAASYSWSPAATLSCITCANPQANPAATTTYTVIGTGANGCMDSAQVTVSVNPLPQIQLPPDSTICLGTSVLLSVSGAATYSWSPATGLSCTNCSNPTASPTVTTLYTVTGFSTAGCATSGQVLITVNPLPTVNAGPDKEICAFSSVPLQATGANSYSWLPAGSLSCNTCDNPVASPTVSTSYVVTGSGGNGCTNKDTVNVTVHPQPQVTASGDTTICEGQSVPLLAQGAQTYLWLPQTGLSCADCAGPAAGPASDTHYTVIGTDLHGCRDTADVAIGVIEKQPFTIGAGDTICVGASTQLFADGGDQYLWTPATGLSSTTVSNPLASPVSSITYTVVIRQGYCFTDTGKIMVKVLPKPTVNAGPDQKIIAGASVNLFATATHTDYYSWSPAEDLTCADCMSPVAAPQQTTTYKVVASNTSGCTAEDDITIFIACDNSQIFLANTFTPNGDGNNDRFYPQGKGVSGIQRFQIFSRWGELVYDTQNFQPNDETKGWDGTFKGEPLKPDVYVYIVNALCINGTPLQIKGDISLIR